MVDDPYKFMPDLGAFRPMAPSCTEVYALGEYLRQLKRFPIICRKHIRSKVWEWEVCGHVVNRQLTKHDVMALMIRFGIPIPKDTD